MLPQIIAIPARLAPGLHEAAPLKPEFRVNSFGLDLAQPEIRNYLIDLKSWAAGARSQETYYQQDPWPCIVNTEVNSGNFIVNRSQKTIHLVDWEMPRWGDPSQDLCHFCSPLTTL